MLRASARRVMRIPFIPKVRPRSSIGRGGLEKAGRKRLNVRIADRPFEVAIRLLEDRSMAQPDRPNFSPIARVIFGVIALAVIVMLLRFMGYLSF